MPNPFRYTGQYQDNESGLYYLRARYYDPATQQFLTRDPIAALTGTVYAYADGSPVNGSDPSGEAFCADAGEFCGGGGAAGPSGGIGGGSSSSKSGAIGGASKSGSAGGRSNGVLEDIVDFFEGFFGWAKSSGRASPQNLAVLKQSLEASGYTEAPAGSCPAIKRADFWKSTLQTALKNAPQGENGGPICEGCGSPIGQGKIRVGNTWRRDYDVDHKIVIWANRTKVLPPNTPRDVVIDLYQYAVKATCPTCNQNHSLEP